MLAVLALALAAAGVWLFTRPNGASAAQTLTATVSAGTYQQAVSGTGDLAPTKEADLDFAVSGRVTSVKVSAGDTVHRGDVLATLDRTALRAALVSARAQLAAAEARYGDDADASATQIASDRASVASASSSLSQARDNLAAATLTATVTGTVASVNLSVGEEISGSVDSGTSSGSRTSGSSVGGGNETSSAGAGSQSGGGSPGSGSLGSAASGSAGSASASSTTSSSSQVVVVAPRYFKVVAAVSARDVPEVKKGMEAQVTPSGSSAAVYGTVTSVGLVAESSSSGAATFPVTVTLTGPHADLYSGTSTTVSIITKQVSNVLAVPDMALHTSGSTTYVEKLVKGKRVRTTVQVGQTYGASTEITSGLKAGDKVVLVTMRLPGGTGNRGSGNAPPGGFGNGGGFGGFRGGGFRGGGGTGGGPPAGFSGGEAP